jgi:hypothetical protein
MKTALIIGGAAIAIYVVWKFGTAAAGPSLSATSAPLGPGNAPFPGGPPPPPNDPLGGILLLESRLSAALAAGTISSGTAVATGLNGAAQHQYLQAGYVIINGNAYPAGPNGRRNPSQTSSDPTGSGAALPTTNGFVTALDGLKTGWQS